ncbi:MAG: dUTP diphosphatase [Candidatus Paceibacterota bacterium]|jgi:dUTP pyrophosphatase
MKLKIKKIHPDAKVPTYAHHGDAGFDVYACEEAALEPGERRTIRLGIAIEIPHGYVGLVWDKSGLAKNHGIINLAGVIDSGFRGESMILLHNLSDKLYEIQKHDKIAQMLIQPVEIVEIEEAEELSESSRGEGGWGSTGKK